MYKTSPKERKVWYSLYGPQAAAMAAQRNALVPCGGQEAPHVRASFWARYAYAAFSGGIQRRGAGDASTIRCKPGRYTSRKVGTLTT